MLENIDHRILDTEVTRIGNQVNDIAPNAIRGRRGKEHKIIDVNGKDTLSQLMSVCVYSAKSFPMGPLVGRLEWGSGGGSAEIEFDIPGPRVIHNSGDTTLIRANPLHLSIVASRVALFARNDANAGLNTGDVLVEPFPKLSLFDGLGVVGAFIGYGTSCNNSKLYRTLVFANPEVNGQLAAAGSRNVPIPSGARRVIFARGLLSSTLSVTVFSDYNVGNGVYVIPAGSPGLIELSPYDHTLSITNTSGVALVNGAARFELEI